MSPATTLPLPAGLAASLGDAAASSLAQRLGSQLGSLFGLDSSTRLYTVELEAGLLGGSLSVEAFAGEEALSTLYAYDILLLSNRADLSLAALVGRQLRFATRLSDGSDFARSGYVAKAERLAADGALARYRLRVVPWLWLATQRSDCRVFQEKTVLEIVDAVFAAYLPRAHWQLAEGVESFMADAPARSYCVQYRESDFNFITRLLAEEGLGYCFVEREDDNGKPLELGQEAAHSLLIFSANERLPEDTVSAHSLGGRGVRFHRAASQEDQDAITAFGGERKLAATITTALSWDYKGKASITASAPTTHAFGSANAPQLESYELPGAYAFASGAVAERYVRLEQEAREARYKRFVGTGSVRSFRPGHRFVLADSPLDAQADLRDEAPDPSAANASRHFLLLTVQHAGINNLPRNLGQAASALGEVDAALPAASATLLAGARARGYANHFEAQRVAVQWRPALQDEVGMPLNPRPTAPGMQTAIVVGPDGETTPGSAGEIHTDALHRVRVRFHWQRAGEDLAPHTTWLRVASRHAGAGLGAQFVPRIGQEVLVGFLEGDIDRPIVLGSLFNGQGDGGVTPTPGDAGGTARDDAFAAAADHRPAAQGNLAGGNSPAWHGEAEAYGTHRNAAALSGFKSAELNTPHAGYTQLVFDDTDGQQRIQLATTQAATQLNLGHLVHQADNYRGSHRGDGFELRTDAYGAMRAARGALFTTWGIQANAGQAASEPAGDAAAPLALWKQAVQLTQATSQIATTHQTVAVAASQGSQARAQSALDREQAPLAAQQRAAGGMLGTTLERALSDAGDKSTAPATGKLPHSTDPLLTFAARGGLGMIAGQHLHWTAGETLTWASGQDSNFALAQALRLHTGQALGLLASATGAGHLKLVANQGPVIAQAQADALRIAAKEQLKLVSLSGKLNAASPKKIYLAVAGGSAITLEGGNITVQCPGNLTVHASSKSFVGGGNVATQTPQFSQAPLNFAFKRRFTFSV